MLPRVVVHTAVSLDGKIAGFEVDLGLYYGLAGRWQADAILCGSGTILAGDPGAPEDADDSTAPPASSDSEGPLLAVVDSGGRVRIWDYLRRQPYWRDAIALCSRATPPEHAERLRRRGVETVVTGEQKVDLRAALEELAARHGVRLVRVDSGGTLNGALLRAGLVSEVSVMVCPVVVGGAGSGSIFRLDAVADAPISLRLTRVEQLDGGAVWLLYEVAGS
jgi:2,5-diamino-6-(ribosylamino)-4(3H)-pyrimidinone 5'-phosphate reductase